ncbi:MFS transporter [Streptomyces oryzae]|uniref:MFS transporter n=1 Tax=Streptomyces oryzae TaxID=1434886 RepID=A0ABS3X9Z2_9ACTN|nr:MFS transporter [Streptomyces oryzae]MBO8192199.1 MFS transporter [Streptomyces oryzae]
MTWPGRLGGRAVAALGGRERARAAVVLAAVLAMDGADKGTLSTTAGGLKHAFELGNTEIGLLVSVVALSAAVFTVPVGLLTDRVRRTRLLTFSAALWVLATFAAGLAQSYPWLLASRAALGAVTATAGPTVASLTGDFFPAGDRARMYGFVLVGEMVGTGVGFAASSVVADALGWRFAYWWLVVPGAALVWAVARLPEPRRAGQVPGGDQSGRAVGEEKEVKGRAGSVGLAAEQAGAEPDPRTVLRHDPRRESRWSSIRYVLRVRTNLVLIGASALGYFYFTGLRSFATLFVTDHYHVSTSVAGLLILMVGAGAVVGVLTGGRVADGLLRRGVVSSRVLVPAGCLLGVPLLVAPALYASTLLVALPLLLCGAALLGAINPPLDAARLDIVHPYMWGTAEGVRIFLRTLGEAAAPTLFGYVSAHAFGGGGPGLTYTLMLFLVTLLAAALLGLVALRTYPRDAVTVVASHRAITREESSSPAPR